MKQSTLQTLLNEEEVKSAKEILEKEYGREYDILREFFFRRGALIFKNNQYKASSLESLADTILNQLPESKKSIKQFESIILKAAKQYKKEINKLNKQQKSLNFATKHRLALEATLNKQIHPEIRSKSRAYEAVYLGSLLNTSIIIGIWDSTHVNKYEVLRFVQDKFQNSNQSIKYKKLTETAEKVSKKFQHRISTTTLDKNYVNSGFMLELINLGLDENNNKLDPTVIFEDEKIRRLTPVQKAAIATVTLMLGLEMVPQQTSSGVTTRNKENIEIILEDKKILNYDGIVNSYILDLANKNWPQLEERSKNIVLADIVLKEMINKGFEVDSSRTIAYILSKAYQESRYLQKRKNNTIISESGAKGIMQLMPNTIDWMNNNLSDTTIFGTRYSKILPIDKELALGDTDESTKENIKAGIIYWDYLLNKFEDEKLALLAYNWGPKYTSELITKQGKTSYDSIMNKYIPTNAEMPLKKTSTIKIPIPFESANHVWAITRRVQKIMDENTQIKKELKYNKSYRLNLESRI